jgi:phosphopantetheine adenylyltransferase
MTFNLLGQNDSHFLSIYPERIKAVSRWLSEKRHHQKTSHQANDPIGIAASTGSLLLCSYQDSVSVGKNTKKRRCLWQRRFRHGELYQTGLTKLD